MSRRATAAGRIDEFLEREARKNETPDEARLRYGLKALGLKTRIRNLMEPESYRQGGVRDLEVGEPHPASDREDDRGEN